MVDNPKRGSAAHKELVSEMPIEKVHWVKLVRIFKLYSHWLDRTQVYESANLELDDKILMLAASLLREEEDWLRSLTLLN